MDIWVTSGVRLLYVNSVTKNVQVFVQIDALLPPVCRGGLRLGLSVAPGSSVVALWVALCPLLSLPAQRWGCSGFAPGPPPLEVWAELVLAHGFVCACSVTSDSLRPVQL